MVLSLLPDAKQMTIDYLKAHTSVTALLGGPRVYGRTQSLFPQVTVTTFGGRPQIELEYEDVLSERHVQIDIWGERVDENMAQVQLIGRTIEAVMRAMPTVSHARGVVYRVRTITPPRDFADEPGLDRARQQAEFGVSVRRHAL